MKHQPALSSLKVPGPASHPVSELDDHEGSNDGHCAESSRGRRNLLLDDFDEEPRRPLQPSKIIRASDPLPGSDRDPFEPMSVNAADR